MMSFMYSCIYFSHSGIKKFMIDQSHYHIAFPFKIAQSVVLRYFNPTGLGLDQF